MEGEPLARKRARGKDERRILLVAGAAVVVVLALGVALYLNKRAEGTDGSRSGGQEPLPYVHYAPIRPEHRGKIGTTTYKQDKAWRGYNLYVQKPDAAAILIDMQGEVVHRWASREGQPAREMRGWMGWFTVRMTPNGDLYASIDKNALIKLDWNSKLLWKLDISAHHEIVLAEGGDAYVIAAELRIADVAGKQRLIEDDVIDVVSPEGEVKRKISFIDVFAANEELKKALDGLAKKRFAKVDRNGLEGAVKKKGAIERLKTLNSTGTLEGVNMYEKLALTREMAGNPTDLFHANALVVLKAHPSGLWADGDIMASFRYMNLVIVFDPKDNHLKWSWGPGEIFGQHQPSILPNGNVLIHDNGTWRPGTGKQGEDGEAEGGGHGKYSRLVEVDPVAKKVVWTYEAKPRTSFYSPGSGTAQLLPNGDILVAEEDGRAFEVTREGETVWEYFNPKFDKTGKLRSGMYRIERLAPSVVEPLLAGAKPTPP